MERRKSGEASNYGFTLIELLIVIVVLGILAAIVVFSLTGITGQSKTAACTTDAKSVEVAADAFEAKTGAWPVGTVGTLVPTYLHSAPIKTNGYVITLGATNVNVAVNGGAAAVFNDQTGCPAVNSYRLVVTSKRPALGGRALWVSHVAVLHQIGTEVAW